MERRREAEARDEPRTRRDRANERTVRLGPAEVESLVAAYAARAATVEELARRFGVDRSTVMRHLRRSGISTTAERKAWDENTLLEAAAAYERGTSLARLAAEYDVAPNTVRSRLQRAGVRLRPRTGWA